MKANGIDVDDVINNIKAQLEADSTVTPALKSAIEMLMLVTKLLCDRLGLNSKNSSKPPSSDFSSNNKKDKAKDDDTENPKKNKKGGQKDHKGSTLNQVDNPDVIEFISVDQTTLPAGQYRDVGVEKRQVFDLEIKTIVTEYRAQILENEHGKRFFASFPEGVNSRVQYGNTVKAHAVYLSQYQLLPYERIQEYFTEQLGLPLSKGSLYNFNKQASDKIKSSGALQYIIAQLLGSSVVHADETGINIDGKNHWLHTASTSQWTYFSAHKKRGSEAMDAADFLPHYAGILVHDHWKSYFSYTGCRHALCHAHHLRELQRAYEQDKQQWAKAMHKFFSETNEMVNTAGGSLPRKQLKERIAAYRAILQEGEQECPLERKEDGTRKTKQSKSRNLLDRLLLYQNETLRFMINTAVPFTNNQAENDVRMTKVHQKISGCFRSTEGAEIFYNVRSYISTCRKQGLSATHSLTTLFAGSLPSIFQGAE